VTFEATRESIRGHQVPQWFEDAKLGIFIHWGLFSIPAFAPRLAHVSDAFTQHYPLSAVMTPYTEWYDNALRVPESQSAAHHREHWGGRPYSDFREPFEEGLRQWDPAGWARSFRAAGAGYVVLVSKHHDGYCLWPSSVTNPNRDGWCSRRDIVGELAAAVRAEGMKFAVYYSGGIDWSFNPRPVRTLVEFVGSVPGGAYPDYAEAQVRELVERYRPSILWNDISWPAPEKRMLRLMADYYDTVEDGAVNDRWMPRNLALRAIGLRPVQALVDRLVWRHIRRQVARGEYEPGLVPPLPPHCDFRTPEYTSFAEIKQRKWEATRGMTPSFGFNRFDGEEDYEDPTELVRSFIDTVSKNGNLLLNVGPRGEDASIPSPQLDRLATLGGWLGQQGDAIYGTRPWVRAESKTSGGDAVRFTEKAGVVFATVLGKPASPTFSIELPTALPTDVAERLEDGAEIELRWSGNRVELIDAGGANPIAQSFAFRAKPT